MNVTSDYKLRRVTAYQRCRGTIVKRTFLPDWLAIIFIMLAMAAMVVVAMLLIE